MSLFPLHNKIACSYLGECPKQGYEGEGYVWVTIEATKTAPSAPKSQACQTKGRMWGRRFMGCWYSDRSVGGIPRPPASRSHNNTALALYHPHQYHYHHLRSQSNAIHHDHQLDHQLDDLSPFTKISATRQQRNIVYLCTTSSYSSTLSFWV